MEISTLKRRWVRVLRVMKSKRARQIFGVLKRLIAVGIVGLILYQVLEIGWREILRSLPTTPVFYLLFFVLYLLLPTAEVLIYRMIWGIKRFEGFKAFLVKRVYNEEVMGYSGEVYLYLWARRRVKQSDANILRNIRDNNIISAVTSNGIAYALVGMLILLGQIEILRVLGDVSTLYLIIGGTLLVVAVTLLIQFRRYVFALSLRRGLSIFGIYFSRIMIYNTVLILQWMSVIPQVPLGVWFTFLATMIVVNRIPFMPSKDLLFISASIELSRYLDVATASLAGMLLVSSAMAKVSNLIVFTVFNYIVKDPDLEEAKKQRALELARDEAAAEASAPKENGRPITEEVSERN